MIGYKIKDDLITITILKMKDKYLDYISNSNKIKKELKKGVIRNIKNGKSKYGSSYLPLTYIGYGKSFIRRSEYKPLFPMIKYIEYNSEVMSSKTQDSVIFYLEIEEDIKPITLIHNRGKITFNPYSRIRRSYVPKREYIYTNEKTKKKVAKIARNLIWFNRIYKFFGVL